MHHENNPLHENEQPQYFRTYIDDPNHGIIYVDCQINASPLTQTPEDELATLYETFGRAVLLPIPLRTKSPIGNAWQSVTYEQSMTPAYQAELLAAIKSGGNIGVLLGPASDNLHAIDIDVDDFVVPFLTLNPQLARITQSRGAKGCQLFFRPKPGTFYPKDQAFYPLKTISGQKWGEWRVGESGGAQSVVYGIHPQGNQYHFRCGTAVNLYLQDFARINWPPEVVLPWAGADPATAGPPDHLDTRIRAYLDTVNIAVEGQGGSNPTFRVACRLVNGFALAGEQALHYLRYYSETRCRPPWSEKEMRHKIADALKINHPKPRGHLLVDGQGQAQKDAVNQDERVFLELIAKYRKAVCDFDELKTLNIKPRKALLGKWLKEGDTGFVFGERGGGKTWFIDAIAEHVSTGRDLFDWAVPEAANVLLVDGEMSIDDFRARLKGLSSGGEHLDSLHHEILFERTGLVMNLANPVTQKIITSLCIDKKTRLLILDNLSCLFSGVAENEADEWEKILNWLLDLRRRKIAVIIVHHAGVSGRMRGTTKREDAALWIVKIDEVKERAPDEQGARFQSTFTKQRNNSSPEWSREWTFQTQADGKVSIGCTELSFDAKVLQLIQAGLRSASDIADELGVTKSRICRAATRLEEQNLIERRGSNRYTTYEPREFMKK